MRKWRQFHVTPPPHCGVGGGWKKGHKRLKIIIILKQTKGENQLFKETRFAPQNKRSKMPEKNNQPKEV